MVPPAGTGQGSRALRRILVILDAAAVAVAWTLVLFLSQGIDGGLSLIPNLVLAVALATFASVLLIAYQRLYRARVCSVRAVETVRLGRAALLGALLLGTGERSLGVDLSLGEMIGGGVLAFALLRISRDGYRAWLQGHRRQGRHSRRIVIVGANDEGAALYHLVGDHPEFGYRACGVMGDPSDFSNGDFDVPWLGDPTRPGNLERTAATVREAGADGVLVAASALPSTQLNRLVRDLLTAGIHVHLSSGVRGIDHRRLRRQPLAYEPLFYVEPVSLARWQVVTKRGLDLVLGVVGLLVSLPVMAAAALAVKLADGGPVLFRQERVGRDGRPFTILKLRTMVVDAEARQAELAGRNQREGVLFKVSDDPRVTRIGHLLRATSLDELPQLINVVKGDMSLVGPRPALPSEAAQFDEDLLARQRVRPGITGLWQVEARDSTSFRAYQRLDIFYVENWSVSLDLAILIATVQAVVTRALRAVRRRSAGAADGGEVTLLLD